MIGICILIIELISLPIAFKIKEKLQLRKQNNKKQAIFTELKKMITEELKTKDSSSQNNEGKSV